MMERFADIQTAAHALGVTVGNVRRMISKYQVSRQSLFTYRGYRVLYDVEQLRQVKLERGRHRVDCECHRCLPALGVIGQRVMMDAAMIRRLRSTARRMRLTVPELIRTAVELYLEEA